MAVLVRGSISDRPWGMTLGALGLRGLSGQLNLQAEGKAYRIAFSEGVIVAAQSPVASDAAVRLALTTNLITSSQVSDITRRMAATPDRDEVELLAELARLQPEQVARLRRRLVALRAARTFSVERGDFVVEDTVTLPVVEGGELDVRTVVFMGAKNNLSEERLASELARLGSWFLLKREANDDLPQFGFAAEEQQIVQMFVEGAYVDELIVARPEIGDRVIRAIAYSLASCGACDLEAVPRRPPTKPPLSQTMTPAQARTMTPSAAPMSRTMTPSTSPVSRTQTPTTAPMSRTQTPSTTPVSRASTPTTAPVSRTPTPTTAPVSRTPTPTTAPVSRTPTPSTAPVARTTPPSTPPISTSRTPTGTGIPHPAMNPGSSGSTRSPQEGSGSYTVQNGASDERNGSASGSYPIATSRTVTGSGIPRPMQGGGSQSMRTTGSSGVARPRGPSVAPPMPSAGASGSFHAQSDPATGRSKTGTLPPPSLRHKARARRDSSAATEVEQLLSTKLPLLDRGVDHFTLLGLAAQASVSDVRSAYFTLARKLHPDRLAAIGIDDPDRLAQRLMAQVNLAFAVLNDPAKRDEYVSVLRRGGEGAVKAEEARADEMAMRILRAEEAFKQGEMALRREQLKQAIEHFQMAVELQPKEGEYQALLAWAKFAAAPDKAAVAVPTRNALIRAVEANDQSTTALFYLGRVERMLGREKEALQHFNAVLSMKPNHSEAASEARVLQQRMSKR